MFRPLRAVHQKARPRVPPSPPPRPTFSDQRWTSRTMLALSTSVGAVMFYLGAIHGFKQGEAHVRAQLAHPPAPTPPRQQQPFAIDSDIQRS
ncbi:hypothetical protein MOBT1_001932 [Malassezia obtusa]|uniref:Uncharacterized protein n=1 Tax=Malassezia obtusa TaxID=76774 RepID=A0AAF0ITE2_9BASI|nr:hypothetical protein MOBT1_001932 [Malassezia obtusa]